MSDPVMVQEIRVKEIYSDADFNCRGKIPPMDVIELMKSVDTMGLQQPIVIQPYTVIPIYKYRIVVGHRRHQAFVNLGKETIPCIVRADLTDEQAAILNIQENVQRKNLNLLEEARSLVRFVNMGYTWKQIAEKIGQSYGWVQVRATLLQLPEDLQQQAAAGLLNQEQIKDLARYRDDPETLYRLARQIKNARESGVKARININDLTGLKKKAKALKKRSDIEMFKLQDFLRAAYGNGIETKIIAWQTAQVNTEELCETIRTDAEARGVALPEDPYDYLTREELSQSERLRKEELEGVA